MTKTKQIRLPDELAYILAVLACAANTAFIGRSGFGATVGTSIPRILSLRFSFLTLGTANWIVQTVFVLLAFLVAKRHRPRWWLSLLTGFLSGCFMDVFAALTAGIPASSFVLRLIWFITGTLLRSLGVTLFICTLFPVDTYDLFTKKFCGRLPMSPRKAKFLCDGIIFAAAVLLTLVLFGEIRGIGWGTIVNYFINIPIVNLMCKYIDRYFDFDLDTRLHTYFKGLDFLDG